MTARWRTGSLAAVSLAALLLTAEARAAVSKVYTVDIDGNPTFAEITNTGTINATDRLFTNDRLTPETKTQALDGVLTGAAAAGMLVRTTLVPGDQFYALDHDTGFVIVVQRDEFSFILPGGTLAFGKWWLPGGIK